MNNDFTILITNYNKERYIQDAIDSALANDVGVVVVDDCSTDDSPRMLAAMSDIKLVTTQRNSGPSIATMVGAAAIDTPYTVLLDGDDVLTPNAVAYFDHIITKHKVDTVYTTPARHKDIDMRQHVVAADLDAEVEVMQQPLSRYLRKQFAGTCMCTRTELLIECLSEDFFVQDLLLAFNLCRISERLVYSPTSTHFYSPGLDDNLTAQGLVLCKDIARLYLYAASFDEVRHHPDFAKYARRIYASLPPLSFQYPMLAPRWKKRLSRWYRRYLMPNLDYDKIEQRMQFFIDNADGHFNY